MQFTKFLPSQHTKQLYFQGLCISEVLVISTSLRQPPETRRHYKFTEQLYHFMCTLIRGGKYVLNSNFLFSKRYPLREVSATTSYDRIAV